MGVTRLRVALQLPLMLRLVELVMETLFLR